MYEFNATKTEIAGLAGKFFDRFAGILDDEGVQYEKKAVADLIMKHAPDWRRVLNEGQRWSTSGSISGNVTNTAVTGFDDLFASLKSKDFKTMRKWVVNHMDIDTSAIIRGIYDQMYEKVQPQFIPQLVLILADYQYKAAFVADHELNLVACMTEIMSEVQIQ